MSSFFTSPKRSAQTKDGVALVIVLSFLVLIAIIILAFFSSVTTEYSTAKAYAGGTNAKFLTDSATNLVIGQIVKATKPVAANSSSRLTWASQPGMIRTYDDGGGADDCYKLYSSSKMVVNSADVQSAFAADVPQGWNTFPANYTDLNAPVKDHTGKLNFPVIDGNLAQLTINGTNVLTYSSDGSTPDIEGFSIPVSSVPTYSTSQAISSANNPAPMPTQWMYVLQDGTMISPDPVTGGAGSTTATFTTAAKQPTLANPIVGRVAFWTDDETCKLNINTASEGSYFAFPHTSTPTDMQAPNKASFGFAVSPPATGEYNRYPGHPATTCLSVALGKWLNPNGYTIPTAYSNSSSNDSYFISGPLTQFLALAPRNALGGSLAGTVTMNYLSPQVTVDTDRLFATVDELMFTPARTEFNSQLLSDSSSDYRPLDRLQFFLTANSRAAEVTPFNTPKVSMWPQWSTSALRAPSTTTNIPSLKASASLLAFCSSFGSGASSPSGKYEYFFQRYSATSFNSSVQDWTKVPRNPQIANYLYNLGKTPIPGYGGTFVNKYTKQSVSSYPNLIVQCLDSIRSNIDRSAYTTTDYTGGDASGLIYPLVVSSGLPGASAASPLKGFGHYPVCTQIALSAGLTNKGSGPGSTATTGSPVPFLGLQFFFPTTSNPGPNGGVNLTISGTAGFGYTPLAGQPALPATVSSYSSNWGFQYAPLFSWINTKNPPMKVCTWVFNGYTYNNTGQTVTVGSSNAVTFTFQDNDSPMNTIQQYTLTFPQTTMPTPTSPSVNNAGPGYDLNNVSAPSGGGSAGYNIILLNAYNTLTGSSARAMECNAATSLAGDWRLLDSFYNVTNNTRGGTTMFATSKNYTTPVTTPPTAPVQQAHSLRVYAGGELTNAYATSPICLNGSATHPPMSSIAGSLSTSLLNTAYEDYDAPCVPMGMTAALNSLGRPGDWDTGPAVMPDGPYVNPMEQNASIGILPYYQQDNTGSATYVPGQPTPTIIYNTFSPNRLVASPVKFGSLPTGSNTANPQPWQTLLFCPNPAARSVAATNAGISASDRTSLAAEHIGFATPPDHLFLEFFTMPTVQPYAISEPLSTAGKVNLNYQLAPFTNIERSTALRGVFKNTLISGISAADIASNAAHPTPIGNGSAPANRRYKFESDGSNPQMYPNETHYDINRDATIAGIEEHFFNTGNIFRYASEICSVFLVPSRLAGATYAGQAPPSTYDAMAAWWTGQSGTSNMGMTGDNLREEPYDHIYPRVTTKSNSYTVHYRVQILKKRGGGSPAQMQANAPIWNEGKDAVTAEYRGSTQIERYIDPNDPQLNSQWDTDTLALNLSGTADLSHLYKFRIVKTKKFAP